MPSKSLLNQSLRRAQDVRQLEAEAFFQGAHGVAIEPGLTDVQSKFDQQASRLHQESVPRQKKFEAALEQVRSGMQAAENQWLAVKERLGEHTPPFALPLIVAIAAVLVIFAEVTMLAPAMDVIDITEPQAQVLAALGITLIGGLAFHFAWESLASDKFTRAWRLCIRVLAGFVAIALGYWGVLRERQVAFAANLNDNALGKFLASHPIPSTIFFIFITLGAPLMIAAATHYSFHHLRDFWQWRKANARLKRLMRQRVDAQKGLEGEKQALDHHLNELTHECSQWKACYQTHHERGARRQALQEPYWTVPLKATFAALIVTALLFWTPLLVLVPGAAAAWIAAYLYFRRQWQSPTPDEYFELENVQFSSPDTAREAFQQLPAGGQNQKELPQ